MVVYSKWVLRRCLFSLLVMITGLYTSMSSFGIVKDQAEQPAENSDQATAFSEDSNPYSAIIRANVFHLADPPKPVEKPDQALINLPKINITGFTRRSGQPVYALFASVPKDPKELPKYFRLSEGEKDDILELTRIHPEQDAVDVIIAGNPVTLTTKSNSFIQPLPPPPKGGVPVGAVARATVAYNPQPAQPAVPTDNAYSGGVIVAGGGSSPSSGGSTVTTMGEIQIRLVIQVVMEWAQILRSVGLPTHRDRVRRVRLFSRFQLEDSFLPLILRNIILRLRLNQLQC